MTSTYEPIPTRIVLESSRQALAYELAADLERRGLAPALVRSGTPSTLALTHGPGTSAVLVTRLLAALEPLVPETVGVDDNLEAGELVVHLGEPARVVVDVRGDSPALLARVAGLVEQLGLRVGEQHLELQDECKLHHAAAPALPRQLLRKALGWRGLVVTEQDHPPAAGAEVRDRIELRLVDPGLAAIPARERFGVQILSDDLPAGDALRRRLESAGFSSCQIVLREDGDEPRFRLHPGPFSSQRAPADLARLRQVLEETLADHGLESSRFPVQVTSADRALVARIEWPVACFRRDDSRPYAGPFPERFDVVLHSDDVDATAGLREALHAAGFVHLEVRKVSSLLDSPLADVPPGLVVRWAAAGRERAVAQALRNVLEEAMRRLGGALPVDAIEQTGGSTAISIFFPVQGVADGRLSAWLSDPRRYRVRLVGAEGDEWDDLKEQLRGWGLEVHEGTEPASRPRGRLEYGAAPPPLVERLQELVRSLSGSTFAARRVSGGDDMLITLAVPRRQRKALAAPVAEATVDLSTWLGEIDGPSLPFLEPGPGEVRIGNVRLPLRGARRDAALVPAAESFEHFCLEEVTCSTLEHLAAGVLLREPCLLEGETSTSKTSAVLYLAALLRQPVVRINLNGQTDTGELIGRFVPRDAPANEDDPAWLHNAGSLWRWQDGLVVQALRQGWWVLLDEVNLAEPQILERLNSVLEVEPSLVLTEHDNSCVAPVHPAFRLFATMNPAEYAGRSVLSPAYRDRWRGYRFVPRPGEREYLAMLRLLIHGEQPGVTVHGRRYCGGRAPGRHVSLAQVLSDDVLVALARFQVSLEHAAGRGGEAPRLGGRRKERHVFSRRGLLSVLDFLAGPLGVGAGETGSRAVRAALLRYYLGRVADTGDQTLVVQLLEAAGLGPRGGAKA
jgi:hypothetical protein